MGDFESMTALQADTIENLMADNNALKDEVASLRKRIEAFEELDEMSTKSNNELVRQVEILQGQALVLKDIIKSALTDLR
jgi:hypothetical protein